MKITTKSAELGGRTLTLEVGRFAEQATSAVLAKYGDTMVLVTIVSSGERPDLDYFPLNVEYVERLYAGGRIKGSRWVKREGRPSDDAVLKGRIVDRSIRPLFPKGFKNETQVIITILSVDGENDPDMLGVIATSASLAISPIPWKGPVAAVKVGYLAPQNGNEISFLTNPRENEGVFAEAEVVVTATKDKILMLEAGMNQIPEDITLKAIKYGKKEAQIVIDLINDLVKEVGKEKIPFTESSVNEDLLAILEKNYKKEVNASILARVSKENESDDLAILSDTIFENYKEKFDKKEIEKALDYLFKKSVRENILKNGKRPDGRKADQIRDISSEVGLLPRTHGSAHFKRGQTQVLTVTTLGSPSLEQLIESPEGESAKRYMHHYSMPPYSVGETGRVGFPSRREIGHGALAEKAILPVLPPADKFPYAIRLVSEVMSSNGS
ncbi:MAG: Polyribonucleotide nucleotidyltransferase [Candidatus Gottesmanbacteria bacterium GW2011_GWA2_41_12]|nr:MAG: Polyribonucleotide nucleotidyltransferase [Candidatus Gottesmanbacteria bacterium GW2011_GWA2_41_12]